MTIVKNTKFEGTAQGDVTFGRPGRASTWQGVIADNHGLYERRGAFTQLYGGQVYTTDSATYTTANESAQGSTLIESGGILRALRSIEEDADIIRLHLEARIAFLDLEVAIWVAKWTEESVAWVLDRTVVLSNGLAFARKSTTLDFDLVDLRSGARPLLLDFRLRALANDLPTFGFMSEAFVEEDRSITVGELPTKET